MIVKALLFLLFLAIVPSVYALTSTDFEQRAQNYLNGNCNAENLTDQQSVNCYLLNKVNEESASSNLKTYDANGQELGYFVNWNTFYYLPEKRLITINTFTGHILNPQQTTGTVYFTQSNCEGEPYLAYVNASPTDIVNSIYADENNALYLVENNEREELSLVSQYNNETCLNGPIHNVSAWKLRKIVVPFEVPIKLPLEYRY